MFQNHSEIDKIVVSCLHGWKEMVQAYARQFNISKLTEIVEGGMDAQESIRKGVDWLKDNAKEDELVVSFRVGSGEGCGWLGNRSDF